MRTFVSPRQPPLLFVSALVRMLLTRPRLRQLFARILDYYKYIRIQLASQPDYNRNLETVISFKVRHSIDQSS